jgi:hypothetical protein
MTARRRLSPTSRWLSISQASEESSLSESEIRRHIDSGEIPVIELADRLMRITRRDWESFLKRYEAQAVRRHGRLRAVRSGR